MKHGRIEVVDQETLVSLLRHVPEVVLNGCKSEAAGRALIEAGVDDVVCWATLCSDLPGKLFAEEIVLKTQPPPSSPTSLRKRGRDRGTQSIRRV